MEFIISQVCADRIMKRSDYCFAVSYNRSVEAVEQLHLTPEQRKMILGGAAAKILKI